MDESDDLEKSLSKANKASRKAASVPSPAARLSAGNLAARLSPSSHQQASKQVNVSDAFEYDTALHLAFLGSGQGGARIANAFWDIGYRRVGAFNTTDSDFEGLAEEMPKLSLDIGGASKDMQFARQALRGRDEELWDLMSRAWGNTPDCALICAGLGGGTGSGTVWPLVQLARKYMASKSRPPRVGCIVSIPPVDEGQIQARNTVLAFNELLAGGVSPLIIIDNARVQSLYRPSIAKLLPKSNELISQLLHFFNRIAATKSQHITFDKSEFTQLMDGGLVTMGFADIGDVQNPADVSKKIRDELANCILADVDLHRGRKAACVFVGHPDILDSMNMDYLNAGYTMFDRLVGSSHKDRDTQPTVIHRGLYEGTDDGLQCYTLISELEAPTARLQELAKKGGITGANAKLSTAKHLGVA